MEERDLGNLTNFTAQPLVEAYTGVYYQKVNKSGDIKVENEGVPFKYADGTSDSYVKRGFDEEMIQSITRSYNLEQSYRIFTTNTSLSFETNSIIKIGDRNMRIAKVLPLLNTNDNLRMYNFDADIYRRMAVKLIYLK